MWPILDHHSKTQMHAPFHTETLLLKISLTLTLPSCRDRVS